MKWGDHPLINVGCPYCNHLAIESVEHVVFSCSPCAWSLALGTNILCKLHSTTNYRGLGIRHSLAMLFDKVNDSEGAFSKLSQECNKGNSIS